MLENEGNNSNQSDLQSGGKNRRDNKLKIVAYLALSLVGISGISGIAIVYENKNLNVIANLFNSNSNNTTTNVNSNNKTTTNVDSNNSQVINGQVINGQVVNNYASNKKNETEDTHDETISYPYKGRLSITGSRDIGGNLSIHSTQSFMLDSKLNVDIEIRENKSNEVINKKSCIFDKSYICILTVKNLEIEIIKVDDNLLKFNVIKND